ncbi:helix-turn-helix transcriptional regulator [Mycobacterium sp. E1747]|uniref:helix-turn-helix transcriptional regulator n=1 Tax=Mycobacterium sp. E1747 TaxID=1834128 RepID=UPI0018D3E5B6|nr:helix-turn-helix transcriptional regulator [Mycobacterium sp. E1747]
MTLASTASPERAVLAGFGGRVRQACDQARTAVDPRPLERLSAELRAVLRSPGHPPRVSAELTGMLAELAQARAAQLKRGDSVSPAGAVSAVYEQLDGLRTADTAPALIEAAAHAAVSCIGADRVFVSRVTASSWIVQAVAGSTSGGALATLEKRLRGIPAVLGAPERACLDSRHALLVDGDAAQGSDFGRSTGSASYVVAPVLAAGDVELLIHADREPTRGRLDVVAQETAGQFADGLGLLLDNLQLRTTLVRGSQRPDPDPADAAPGQPIPLDGAPLPGGHSLPAGANSAAAKVLSPRELEVMQCMARGQRNAEIAAELILGEATIKSHVAAIMRKLHTRTRAEAVARYLRMAGGTEPE